LRRLETSLKTRTLVGRLVSWPHNIHGPVKYQFIGSTSTTDSKDIYEGHCLKYRVYSLAHAIISRTSPALYPQPLVSTNPCDENHTRPKPHNI
jgi:hypothetical protein